MKKLLIYFGLIFSFYGCTKEEECDGIKRAIVYRWPDKNYEFEMNFPYNCDNGEPVLDAFISSNIIFVRWAE